MSAGRRRLLVGIIPIAAYAPWLDRGFVSEDFLLLRILGERPPWDDWLGFLHAPWLGITVVDFYRPLATLFLAAERKLFGAHPLPYNLVHVAVHALATVLVFEIVRLWLVRRDRPTAPATEGDALAPATWAAALFALHPLHPNAVLFIASFATLIGTALVLVSVWAHLRALEAPVRPARWLALSWLALIGALLSYEAAVAWPLLLGACAASTAILRRAPPSTVSRRRILAAGAVAVIAVGSWLAWRAIVLDDAVGGYADVRDRLFGATPSQALAGAAIAIRRLLLPWWWQDPGGWRSAASGAALVGASLLALRAAAPGFLRAGLLLWAATLIALAPFAFPAVVPGNGRYGYLATVPLATIVALAGARSRRAIGRWALALLLAGWGAGLVRHLVRQHAAGVEAATIAAELAAVAGRLDPATSVFAVGYPSFLVDRHGTPIAQVLRYGLSDTQKAPFARSEDDRKIYPLEPNRDRSFAALSALGEPAVVLVWAGRGAGFRTLTPSPHAGGWLVVRGPEDGAALLGDAPTPRVEIPEPLSAPEPAAAWLWLATEGNATRVAFHRGADGTLAAQWPATHARSMATLYGSDQFWWVDVEDPATGAVVASSPARRVDVSSAR
jgi:hypothetical protein